MGKFIKSAAGRKWLYNVLLALAGVAGAYRIVSGEEAALWLAVGAALLGFPVASANVTNAGTGEYGE